MRKRKQLTNLHGYVYILMAALIVLSVGFLIGFCFTVPGKVWSHEWFQTPEGLTASATVLAAIATFCAVIVALFGMRNERVKAQEDRKDAQEKFLASQKQTQEALEESRKQFIEAQYEANRPLLIPLPWGKGLEPRNIEWDKSPKEIEILNAGAGIATNVWGLLVPPADILDSVGHFTGNLYAPLPKDKPAKLSLWKWPPNLTPADKVAGVTYCVQPEPPKDQRSASLYRLRHDRIARLLVFYSDIFGRDHVSIFDHTRNAEWLFVTSSVLKNVPQMLDTAERAIEHKIGNPNSNISTS